ncbi:MAG: hypothetical protein EXR77_09080 [Myxococcales bacterium]|nr:hypothetical protein [Myxococcales bacterium]
MSRLELGAVVATLAVRLLCAFALPAEPLNPDFAEYSALASQMHEHGEFGFGDNWVADPHLRVSFQAFAYEAHQARFRTPGFPALLVGVRALGFEAQGGGIRMVQVVLALCDALVALLLVRLACLVWDQRVAIVAVAAWVANPGANYLMTKVGREELLTVGVVASVALTYFLATQLPVPSLRNQRSAAVALGAISGLTAYCKETALPVLAACLLWLAWHAWQAGQRIPWTNLTLAATSAAVVIAPWIVRNSLITGHFTGLSTMGPVAAYLGLMPRHFNGVDAATVLRLAPTAASSPSDAALRVQALLSAQWQDQPVEMLGEALKNMGWFWSPVTRWQSGPLSAAHWAVALAYCVLYALAARGMWLNRHKPFTQLSVSLLLCATAMHAVALSVPRYRFPFEPLLMPLAAAGLLGVRRLVVAKLAGDQHREAG